MKTIRVAAAIIQDGDKILACQRGYGEFKGGWEFPGGKLEEHETSAEACIREIKEELDVAISVQEMLCTVEHDYDSFHLSMDCFLCSLDSGTINDSEHEDLRWLSKADLRTVDWLAADITVVDLLEQKLA